jgi:hypothetical protein
VIESDADRLAMIQAVGEAFDTGSPTTLYAIFDRPHEDVLIGEIVVVARRPVLYCRTSDLVAHSLVKQSKVTRVSDGRSYFVKDLEDDGVGITVVALS